MDTSSSPVTPGGGSSCFEEKGSERSGFSSACSFASTVRPNLTPASNRGVWSCLPDDPRASSVFASSIRSFSADFPPSLDQWGARSAPVGFNCNTRELADEEEGDIRKKFSRCEPSPRDFFSKEDFSGDDEILSIIGDRFFSNIGLEGAAGHSSENGSVCDVDEPASRAGSMEPSEVCALVVAPVGRGVASAEPTLSDLMDNDEWRLDQEDFALNGWACDVDEPTSSAGSMESSEVCALVVAPVGWGAASTEPTSSGLMANNKRKRAQ